MSLYCLPRNHYIVLHCKNTLQFIHPFLYRQTFKWRGKDCWLLPKSPSLFLSNFLLRLPAGLAPRGGHVYLLGVLGGTEVRAPLKTGTLCSSSLSLFLLLRVGGLIVGAPAAAWDHVAMLRREATCGSDSRKTDKAGSLVTCGAFSPGLDF